MRAGSADARACILSPRALAELESALAGNPEQTTDNVAAIGAFYRTR